MRWIEQQLTFQNQDMANVIAIYGYSVAYFFLFPLLAVVVPVALARRPHPKPYRVFAVALAVDYAISLCFFLAFPVPERWAFPEAGAILLSDQWSSTLIEAFRPMSALDNCFPSFHVSMTTVMVLVCYLYGIRLRTLVAALGAIVTLSTFVLGIHWIPDLVSGVAVAVTSVCIAERVCTWWATSPRSDPPL
jgi:membrane-associated phospholipid phosphatase